MSDKQAQPDVTRWLDELFNRIAFAQGIFEHDPIDDPAVLDRFLDFCDRLRDDLDAAVQIGLAMGHPMQACACLFHSLRGEDDPAQYAMRAKIEVRSLAVAIRQASGDPADDQITRNQLLKMLQVDSSTLNYRIKHMGFPPPCRVEGRKQWFSTTAVDQWRALDEK